MNLIINSREVPRVRRDKRIGNSGMVISGQTGLPGLPGALNFAWVKYRDDAESASIYNMPTNASNYIGIAFNKSAEIATDVPDDYTWFKFKGDAGAKGEQGATGIQGLQGVQGVSGNQGIQGATGTSGLTSYFHIKYSNNGTSFTTNSGEDAGSYIGTYADNTASDSNTFSSYSWVLVKGAQGITGTSGIAGANGTNGQTSYLHIKYSDNGTSFTASSGETVGAWIGTMVDFVSIDSTTFSLYTWNLIKGQEGIQGLNGIQGATGGQGIAGPIGSTGASGLYYENRYAKNGSTTVPPTLVVTDSAPSGWSTAMPTVGALEYLWLTVTQKNANGTLIANWPTPNRTTGVAGATGATGTAGATGSQGSTGAIGATGTTGAVGGTGATGNTGAQGIQGTVGVTGAIGGVGVAGANGLTSYFHIKYSDNGTSFTANSGETSGAYIGTYVDNTAADSMTFSLYTWTLVKGAQGLTGGQGLAGTNGTNGQTSYLHLAYANDAAGTNFHISDPTGRAYIGQYTDFVLGDSGSWNVYTWSLIKGATGTNGTNGTNGVNGELGPIGPSTVSRGDYNSGTTYYGNSKRVDVVKYNGSYYAYRSDFGQSAGATPDNTAWANPYGATYDNIATGLLFADTAYIDNLVVRRLESASTGKRIIIDPASQSITIYDGLGKAVVEIYSLWGDSDIGTPIIKLSHYGGTNSVVSQTTLSVAGMTFQNMVTGKFTEIQAGGSTFDGDSYFSDAIISRGYSIDYRNKYNMPSGANVTMPSGYNIYLNNYSTVNQQWNLPSASAYKAWEEIEIVNCSSIDADISVRAQAGNYLNTSTYDAKRLSLDFSGACAKLRSDGVNHWYIVSLMGGVGN